MQFLPQVWPYYSTGDINNPRDAILAAARFLKAHGGPQDMAHAVYRYNPSHEYVEAVVLYAQQMQSDVRAFYGYYYWQVYVNTTRGPALLPEGFSN
jgi:membrane-bound lytic murein transglycosylase B